MSRFIISLFIVFNFTSVQAETVFSDMLILGASMSADYAAPSPGKFLAEQAGLTADKVQVQAKNGVRSSYHRKFIQKRLPTLQPDVIVALDFFFHDFKWQQPLFPWEEYKLRTTVGKLVEHTNLLLLGTAIGLNNLGGVNAANRVIYEMEAQYENLMVVDINTLFQEIHSADGYAYDVNGVQMTIKRNQVMADPIHPNEFGTRIFANIIIQQLRQRNPDITERDLPYLDISSFL